MSVVTYIKNNFSKAVVKSCSEKGCYINLTN
jgi:hypothetical protein